jgi:hypothetical protein
MGNAYNVPSQILGDQGVKVAALYRADSAANRALLDGVGVPAAVFDEAESLGRTLLDEESSQEMFKADALVQKNEAVFAVSAVMAWRSDDVLPRVKLAFGGDRRYRFFRAGQLKSVRTATVLREAKLLVGAIRKFAGEAELARRGVGEAMALRGEALIAAAEKEDVEAAQASAAQIAVSENVYALEDKLDDVLAEIERSAAVVFKADSADLARYRMNEIRDYAAKARKTSTDATASVSAEDPTAK